MKKRSVFRTLMKNYVVFTSILVLIVLVTLLVGVLVLNQLMASEDMPLISPSSIVKSDYEEIDMSDLQLANGWIEVLDNDGNVIYINGEKQTDEMMYERSDLMDLLGFQENLEYFYQSMSFTSSDGEELTLLVVLPYDVVDYEITLAFGVFDVSRKILYTLLISVGLFLCLFLINMYFYSKWTSKKIKNPLNKITKVMEKMRSGDKDVRMQFEAEHEFLEIKEAFNMMADELQSSMREKEKIEESKNQAFMNISHDLKTPITSIVGYAKALNEGMISSKEEQQKYLATIEGKASHMAVMIDEVFALAKLQQQPSLKKETQDFMETLRVVMADHYEQVEDKGMKIKLSSMVDKVMLRYDAKEMYRVFSNLIVNAIRYNKEGTLIAIEVLDDKEKVEVLVKDTGIGIPASLRETIFQPFVRADDARKTDGGSGLGLSIAKQIVDMHDGEIKLIEADNVFSTIFVLTLPKK